MGLPSIAIVRELFAMACCYSRQRGELGREMFEVDLTALRSKVNSTQSDWKSVTLLEQCVVENSLQCDSNMFKAWRTIIDFRNASFPYHETDGRVIELTAFFARKHHQNAPNYG